jgi:nitroreductase
MEVNEAILARHSVREFKSTPVPKAVVMKILETSVHAPSSGNSQPWNIYVAGGAVLDKIRKSFIDRSQKGQMGKAEMSGTPPPQMPKAIGERMKMMRDARMKLLGLDPDSPESMKIAGANGARLFGAPVLIVLTMDKVLDKWAVYDIGMLSQNICLSAQAAGLGTLIGMAFVSQPDILRAELGIPDDQIIVIGIGLGYFDQKSKYNDFVSSRRPIGETITLKGF